MRQHGYRVTITGFIPVDPRDIMSQKAAIDAITGGPAAVIAAAADITVEHKLTSRAVDAPTPAPATDARTAKKSA